MPRVNGAVPAIDSLDSDNYDPITHLNLIFSATSTLARAPTILTALRTHQDDLSDRITSLQTIQAQAHPSHLASIRATQSELANLFSKIDGVRTRALETERAITTMTADIKRLDSTKRNLTLSMTALKRLQMLTTAYEQLLSLSKTRQYRECAQLLQAVIQLMAHFKSYRSIDQIATLSRNVADLQRELLEQVCGDFEEAFAKGEMGAKTGVLGEACKVLEALGDNARARLVTWYCNASLREYRSVFRGTDEAGSLDNISRRYAWFNRLLKTYDVEHSQVFPAYWKVNEQLANAFCESTRDDFKGILQRASRPGEGQTLDVDLLLSSLQETLDFEHSLEKRFASGSRPSMDSIMSSDDRPQVFGQAISAAFGPYLTLWVEAQDRQLSLMISRFRIQPLRNTDDEFSPQSVIASSPELFNFYRITLAQCAKLSTSKQLLELSQTFAKYLDQYSQQVLFYSLDTRFGPQGPVIEDIVLILNTADYCFTTCSQLEEKIKSRIDSDFKDKVDLQSQGDTFMGLASAAIRSLVRKVEQDCEPGWREMRNTAWSRLENVSDQSSYVGELLKQIRTPSASILKYLHKPQYARAFLDNLVESLTNTYITSISQCRPISEVGAEQMLLDSYVLKKVLTDLPNINSDEKPPPTPNPAYAKRVAQTTSKIDPLLKTLQVQPQPAEALVQAYLIHIADTNEANFRKILDIKGIARRDQNNLVDLFNAHRTKELQAQENAARDGAPASTDTTTNSTTTGHRRLVSNSAVLAPLQIPSTMPAMSNVNTSSSHPFSAVSASTPNLPALASGAAGFASGILSAPRDLVDRFGAATPAFSETTAGGSVAPSRNGTPGPGTANDGQAQGQMQGAVTDNLRNIGKFFRRDIGGFGGRFGGKGGGERGSLDVAR